MTLWVQVKAMEGRRRRIQNSKSRISCYAVCVQKIYNQCLWHKRLTNTSVITSAIYLWKNELPWWKYLSLMDYTRLGLFHKGFQNSQMWLTILLVYLLEGSCGWKVKTRKRLMLCMEEKSTAMEMGQLKPMMQPRQSVLDLFAQWSRTVKPF